VNFIINSKPLLQSSCNFTSISCLSYSSGCSFWRHVSLYIFDYLIHKDIFKHENLYLYDCMWNSVPTSYLL